MSITIIESLIVKLGLDSSDLSSKGASATKSLKDIQGQSAKTEGGVKKIGSTSKSSASGVETLTRTLGTFLALIGGTVAIKAFIEDTIASSAALDRLAKNLNISAGEITAWSNATEELGGSAKGLHGSLDLISKAQTDLLLTGTSSLIPYLSTMGVAIADVDGKARKATDIFADMASFAEGKDRPTAHNMFATMGLDEGTINLLLQGRKELELSLKRQKDYGDQIAKFAPEATKLQRSLVDLKQNVTLLGLTLLQRATPAIEKVLEVLTKFGGWINANKEFVGDFLTVLAVGLGALSIAALPLTGTALIVGALGAAIALLWQDYQTWKRGGDSLINWALWEKGIDLAKGAINELAREAKAAFGAIYDSVDTVQKLLGGDIKGAKVAFTKSNNKMREAILPPALATTINGRAPLVAGGKESLETAIEHVEGFFAHGKKPNRPQRNHNGGDIEDGKFARAHGAIGSDGRFAIFPDDATGHKALAALLKTKAYQSRTVEQTINRFAPPNENNTDGYIKSVTARTGLKANDLLSGIGGASNSVAHAGSAAPGGNTSTDKSVSVQTGDIHIQTAATDAGGIARDIGRSLNSLFTSQANSGLAY